MTVAPKNLQLGFIGVGTITASVVTGLGDAFGDSGRIHLSPRNEAVAHALAERFAHVQIAGSNQDVVDRSDIVVLAIRPQIAQDVISAVRFRPEHHVISLIATFSAEVLRTLIAPARQLTKAVPLPSAALGHCATAIYPSDPVAAGLFSRVGAAVEVDDPDVFDALTAVTAVMAPYFNFAETLAKWLAAHALPPGDARRYVGSLLYGLALTTQDAATADFKTLATDHATAGGINEELSRRLADAGVFTDVERGLDAILARIQAPRSE